MNTTETPFDFALDVREGIPADGVIATMYGRAVPYDTETSIGSVRESFAPGSFDAAAVVGRPLAWRHDAPIGVITHASNEADGLYITANILDTVQGRDAATLAKAGAVTGLSVGFTPTKSAWSKAGDAVRHLAASLAETSLTHMPAYATAGVASIREKEDTMSEQTVEETTAVAVDIEARESIASVRGDIAALEARAFAGHAEAHPLAQYRSFGEYSQAVMSGETESRAIVDQITSDNPGLMPPQWMSDVKNIVALGRPGISAMGVMSAGASGMDYAWPYFDGDLSLIVAAQATQKTDLNSVLIKIKKATASLATYGAASDISYQLLQRSSPSYLDSHNRIMAASYALITDNVFVDALDAASIPQNYNLSTDTDGSKLRAAVFQASVAVETATGSPASVVLMSSSAYIKLGGWSTFLPAPYGTVNLSGTATASSLGVSVSGLPVVHDRNLPAGSILVTNSSCAKWIEDGPRLAEVDVVTKLGRDVAIYGYGTTAIYTAAGIISLEVVA